MRRYVKSDQTCSQIATIAAKKAIKSSKIDPETIDMIIVAQNFDDVTHDSVQSDQVPSIASRVKHELLCI